MLAIEAIRLGVDRFGPWLKVRLRPNVAGRYSAVGESCLASSIGGILGNSEEFAVDTLTRFLPINILTKAHRKEISSIPPEGLRRRDECDIKGTKGVVSGTADDAMDDVSVLPEILEERGGGRNRRTSPLEMDLPRGSTVLVWPSVRASGVRKAPDAWGLLVSR